MDKQDLFKEGAIALEALSETTNGDADIVVMKSTCQSPKFFEAQPTAPEQRRLNEKAQNHRTHLAEFHCSQERHSCCDSGGTCGEMLFID